MVRPTGEKHHAWKGDKATYDAFHRRVYAARGSPQKCDSCETVEGKMQWANLTGNYADVNDYERLCISCHRRKDHKRRVETGEMTSIRGTKDGKFRHSHRVILTKEQVLEARKFRENSSKEWTWAALGRRYGVCANAIKFAVTGKNWPHLL